MKLKDNLDKLHSYEELFKHALKYDRKLKRFRWRISPSQSVKAGDIAGHVLEDGYRRVTYQSILYPEHWLIWFYFKKRWPTKDLDHVNGVRSDNRVNNLREATCLQNTHNRWTAGSHNMSGYLGVTTRRWGKKTVVYEALIHVGLKQRHIGYYDTPQEAHEAYLAQKRIHHPFGEIAKSIKKWA